VSVPTPASDPSPPAGAPVSAPEPAPALPAERGALSAAVAAPFWQRLPLAVLLVRQREPLIHNAIAAAVFGVAASLAFAQAVLSPTTGAFFLALAWCAATGYLSRYLFRVIDCTAAGYFYASNFPVPERAAGSADEWARSVRLLALLGPVPVALALLDRWHLPALVLVIPAVAYCLMLPACVVLLAGNDDLKAAVDVTRVTPLVRQFGPAYLLLCALPLLLCLGIDIGADILARLIPAAPPSVLAPGPALPAPQNGSALGMGLAAFCLGGGVNALLIFCCALLGHAMHEHGAELGIAVVGPGAAGAQAGRTRVRASTSSAAHARRVREALIAKLAAGGDFREAIQLLTEDLGERPSDLSLHARLHAVLVQEGSRPRIEEHADRYLGLLMTAGNAREALALFEQTRAAYAGFTLKDAERLPPLARAALDASKPALAAELLRGFDRRHPGHPDLPEVYVLGARVMLQAERATEARQLFAYVAKKYPDSAAAQEAKRFLARFS
jgi:hypothetical protein